MRIDLFFVVKNIVLTDGLNLPVFFLTKKQSPFCIQTVQLLKGL